MGGTSQYRFSIAVYILFTLCVNHLSARNSVNFYTSSSSSPTEQSEVVSGRSIGSGYSRQTHQNNHNHNNDNNPNDRPLKTTGFAFKGKSSFGGQTNGDGGDGGGQTSPIPFVIPSYASGIIFRNSDNDKSPQVEIQPAIHISSKTIGPEEAAADGGGGFATDTATASTFKRIRPTTATNVNLVNSFERKTFTPLHKSTSTITQAAIVKNEIQNNSPIQTVSTTLLPTAPPSQINTMPTIDKTTNEPRFSDLTKRVEILGLQAPGYAIRNDGTIDSDAIPPNFLIDTNANFASTNNLGPLDVDASSTTTPRITRTTQHQFFHPTAFVPSNDNPFLPRQSNRNAHHINAAPVPFAAFQSSTQANTFKGSTSTQSARFSTVNNNRNQQANGNGFASFAPQTSTNPSPFIKTGTNQNPSKLTPNQANGQFGNQLNSRQSKSNNEIPFNIQQQPQQQAQRKNSQFVLNLDNRARLPPFGIAETTTTFATPISTSTTKRVQAFANSAIPTAKAPAGFSFNGFAKTTIKPPPRTRIVPTTIVPTTFSTIFPSKYTFKTFPTTVAPIVQSEESSLDAAEPSIELLPPISSSNGAKSAFAPINEAGALIRSKSPAFSAGITTNNRNQQQQPSNTIKHVNANNAPPNVKSGFTAFPITTTTKAPIRYRPAFSTSTFKFTTATPTAAPKTTSAVTTTSFASIAQLNQPSAKAQEPYIDLLPPIDSDTNASSFVHTNNGFEQSSAAVNFPNNDLLPPIASNVQTQNAQSTNAATPNSIHRSTATVHDASATAAAGAIHTDQNAGHSDLDLNPFLPPVSITSKSETSINAESNSGNNEDYTTITLEQNPFLPQLDLNPFLPPFVFSPSENDSVFGAGSPPPPSTDDDETSASSIIAAQSVNAPLKFRLKRSLKNKSQQPPSPSPPQQH